MSGNIQFFLTAKNFAIAGFERVSRQNSISMIIDLKY